MWKLLANYQTAAPVSYHYLKLISFPSPTPGGGAQNFPVSKIAQFRKGSLLKSDSKGLLTYPIDICMFVEGSICQVLRGCLATVKAFSWDVSWRSVYSCQLDWLLMLWDMAQFINSSQASISSCAR